uniref:Optineurin n=1 Tax=Nothobranchius kuhntae TaxID=321403 RepID=A0A1A8HMR1_NOTKU
MESDILKFICANQGAVDAEELRFNLFPSESTNEVISNQKKFVLYSVNGKQKVVARTSLRLCRNKECPGPCGGLHLCKNYLFSGTCQFLQQGRTCRFSHDLNSHNNQRLLKEHELECLDRVELCTLLLQSEHTLLPSICHDYNNGDGEFGRCQSGISCARLHICERYLNLDCSCIRSHDFYDPQPLKTLYDKGVPDSIFCSLKAVYANKAALRNSGSRAQSHDGLEQRHWYPGSGRGASRGNREYRSNRGNWTYHGSLLQQQRTSSIGEIHTHVDFFNRSKEDRPNNTSQQRDPNSFYTDARRNYAPNRHRLTNWNQSLAFRGRGIYHHRLPRARSNNDISAAGSNDGDEQSSRQRLKHINDQSDKAHIKMPNRCQVQERGQCTHLSDNETRELQNQSRTKELEESGCEVEETTQTESEEESELELEAASEVENLKSQVRTLFKDLQQAQCKLDEAEGMKKNLQDRCQDLEQEVASLKAQLVEKQVVPSEKDRLKLHLVSEQTPSQLEQREGGEERNNLAQLKDAYTKLFEDYNELKEEKKKRESRLVEKELADDLQERLTAAEEALAVKQSKIDEMKQEMFSKEKDLETISVFQAQAEVYSSDFYAERAAREKLHEEKERLAAQLEFVKKQNSQLQEEMDSLGRRSLNEMQRRHGTTGGSPHGAGASLVGRGADWQHQGNIPEHACPKCNEILPDLDSLQIHIMDCIN